MRNSCLKKIDKNFLNIIKKIKYNHPTLRNSLIKIYLFFRNYIVQSIKRLPLFKRSSKLAKVWNLLFSLIITVNLIVFPYLLILIENEQYFNFQKYYCTFAIIFHIFMFINTLDDTNEN